MSVFKTLIKTATAICIAAGYSNPHNTKRKRRGKTAADHLNGCANKALNLKLLRATWQKDKGNKSDLEFQATCKGNGNSSNRRPERNIKQNWTSSSRAGHKDRVKGLHAA